MPLDGYLSLNVRSFVRGFRDFEIVGLGIPTPTMKVSSHRSKLAEFQSR